MSDEPEPDEDAAPPNPVELERLAQRAELLARLDRLGRGLDLDARRLVENLPREVLYGTGSRVLFGARWMLGPRTRPRVGG